MLNRQHVTAGTSTLQLQPDYRAIERRYKRAIPYYELHMSVIAINPPEKSPKGLYGWRSIKNIPLWMLYDPDELLPPKLRNKGRDELQLFMSVSDGLAVVTGKPSEDLFVIDCDSVASGQYVLKCLAIRGIHAPYVETARGIHVYLKSRNGTIASIAPGKIPDIEIKSDGNLVVFSYQSEFTPIVADVFKKIFENIR